MGGSMDENGPSLHHTPPPVLDERRESVRSGTSILSSRRTTVLSGPVVPVGSERRASVLHERAHQLRRLSRLSLGIADDDKLCIENLMASWPLLRSCCPGTASTLVARVVTQSFAPGQEIVHAGLVNTSLIFVVRGAMHVLVGETRVGTLTSGQYLGETLVLGIEEHWAVTLCAGDEFCTIGEVKRDDFLAVSRPVAGTEPWLDAITSLHRLSGRDRLLASLKLFNGLSEKTLHAISQTVSSRLFFPGESLIQDGAREDHLLILLHGRVTVEMAGRVVRTHNCSEAQEPICLGELGLLGLEQIRSATVTAQSVCFVQIIFRPVFLRALQEYSDSMHVQTVAEFVKSRTQGRRPSTPASQSLYNAKMFQEAGCSESFLSFLTQHLEERVYLCDQRIVEESADNRCMYILSHGSAKVMERGRVVTTLKSGTIIGEMNLLGVVDRQTETIVATEICYVEVLHPSIVLRGLELFAEERPKVFAVAYASTSGANVPPADIDQEFRRSLIGEVMKAPFFDGMTFEFVEKLSALSVDRIFLPSELIVEEGRTGDSMFIIVSGEASVFLNQMPCIECGASALDTKKDEVRPMLEIKPFDRLTARKVDHLVIGGIFGELAMLGIAPTRRATVQADTLCSLWEIRQSKVLNFMEDFPYFRRKLVSIISAHLEPTVSLRLQSLPLFQEFDQQFRMLLCLSCKRRVFFPGEMLACEGLRGEGVLILNVGEAKLEHALTTVTTFQPGSYLGCEIMLGIQKTHTGTLTATQVCHVLVIPRESYRLALQKYPSPIQEAALLDAVKKESEAFQTAMKRLRLKVFIMQRCTAAAQQSDQEQRGIQVGMLESELNVRTFRAWSAFAQEQSKFRRQTQFRRNKEQEWISRHLHARNGRLMEEHLALEQSERFDWVSTAAWDSSTIPTGKRSKHPRLPRIAPIGGISLRSVNLMHQSSSTMSTPRAALPPIAG